MTAAPKTPYSSPLQPPCPEFPGQPMTWARLYGSSFGLLIDAASRAQHAPVVVVAPDTLSAQRLEEELRFYCGAGGPCPILLFPDWETLPYDVFSPHQDIISQRLSTLSRLPELKQGVVVLTASTLMQRLAPKSYVQAHSLFLDLGERIDIDGFRRRLQESGYLRVSQVMEHGEYAVRGSLIDLFPMGSHAPLRIDLLDDEIESIRTFDPETQRSLDHVERVRLLPAREFPLTEQAITRFRQAFRSTFEGNPNAVPVYTAVSQGNAPPGIEYYLPLFFERTESLFDYLPQDALFVLLEDAEQAFDAFDEDVHKRFDSHRHDRERPLLSPDRLFLSPQAIYESLSQFPEHAPTAASPSPAPSEETFEAGVPCGNEQAAAPVFRCVKVQRVEAQADPSRVNFATSAAPTLTINPRAPNPSRALLDFMDGFDGRILIAAETAGRREILLDLLRSHDRFPKPCENWRAFLQGDTQLAITVAPLEQGLLLEQPRIAVIAEGQLFGEQAKQRRRRRPSRDTETIVRDLTELDVGAPVVHEEHGVGRYLGLQTLTVGGIQTEFLTLEYAGGDKLYVPVASLHLISRYTGATPESAPLHQLGGEQWARAKRRASQKARDVAAELLDIYARRAARKGHAFPPPDDQYSAFVADFPFEETPDQQTAINDVVADMASDRPMDRLVCGDVGFGKTEVAMRAAFLAVHGGKQIAVLVPTTLLAQQHYQTFKDRFADWPVRIEALSRFRSRKQQEDILAGLREGTVDIVIGTHKLLQRDIKFNALGLVIIDEEHRFGVRQKERFKTLRSEVDVLALTATPIPRTLNLALSQVRELSVIATPPSSRLSIKTFVHEWDTALLEEAFHREIKRGGQVYFVHNEVRTIERMEQKVRELVPNASVRIAHGQMRESELERTMLDFYHQRFNVLVCTTIIETGIDVPTANTMIINRADKFGLAQLYQLRGRVGRSHHRAYAYLVLPAHSVMTPDAVKRIEAVESLEELGSGFMLATHDLEIRGAGELLGEEQSGHMQEIGFTLYTEYLDRAVCALRSGQEPDFQKPINTGTEIDLHIPALIPQDYLPDVHTRLIMYKRIANARTEQELEDLQVEMIDRFGLLPQPAKHLFRATELKLKATALGIDKIDAGARGGRIEFGAEPDIDPARLVQLIQTEPQTYQFDGSKRLRIVMDLDEPEDRLREIDHVVDLLSSSPHAAQAGRQPAASSGGNKWGYP